MKLRTLPRIRSRIIIKLTHRGRETGRRASLGKPTASLRLKRSFVLAVAAFNSAEQSSRVSFDVNRDS